MTIQSASPRVIFVCNGTSTVFPVPIQAYNATDFEVILINAAGVQSVLTLNSDYSLAASGTMQPPQWSLTTLAAAPQPSGCQLQIFINPVQTQQTQYVQGQAFPSLAVQTNLDRLTQMVQRLQDEMNRCPRAPDGDISPQMLLPTAVARALTSLGFDANGNVSLVTLLPTALTQTQFNSFFANTQFYAQTSAETTVFGLYGGSIANYFAAVGRPERYTINAVPGTTDMTTAVQTAYYVIAQVGGRLELTGGPYFVSAPINCTVTGSAASQPVVVRGVGGKDQPYTVIAQHNGVAIFDCTGNDSIIFEDMCIGTVIPTSNPFPQCGILLARNSAGGSLINQLRNVKIIGYFSVACLYNYGSENSVCAWCYFGNFNPAAGVRTRIYTANNISGLSSSFTTIASGAQSCTVHNDFGNADVINSGTATSDCICLEVVGSFTSVGGWASCNGGRAGIYVDQTNGYSSDCRISGFSTEKATTLPKYGIFFGVAGVSRTPVAWEIHGCKLYSNASGGYAIAANDANTTANGFWINRISEATSQGINWPGAIAGQSYIMTGSMVLNVGSGLTGVAAVTQHSTLIGDSTNWTFGGNGVDGTSWACNVAPYASGFGTPTGNTITANFPGATATLLQTSGMVAEILLALKARGILLA